MKKPLFVHTVPMAQPIGKFRPQRRTAANSLSTTNDPTHHGGERVACKCTASETQYMQRGSNNELRNVRGRTGSPHRLLPHATIVSAKGASETIQTSEQQSEQCVASCATFACAKIQRTNGWARGIPSFVCCVLCVMCLLYVVCCLLLLLCVSCVMRVVCVRGPACCVVCVSCMLCVCCPLVSYMLRVRCHACRTCRARFHNIAENAPMTYRTKR